MKSKRPVIIRRQSQRGSSLVESTLCFLGFMMLSLGLMEFSMAVYAYNFVTYASADAARYASLHGSHSSVPATVPILEQRVRTSAIALVANRIHVNKNTDELGNPIENTPDHPAGFSPWAQANGTESNDPGSVVTVRVTYQVHPLVNLVIKNFMKVSSTSQMTIAN